MKAEGGRLSTRLRRILLLLPYAIRHPGVSVDELSRKFGVAKKDLIADLDLLFLCGLPGYGPGDLIDVTVEEDSVYVRMADYFASPLRLTSAEGLALYAGAATLLELPDMAEADALRRAIHKLGRALGISASEGGDGEQIGLDVKLTTGPDEHLAELRRALDDRKQIDLEYFSAHRGELTQRTIDPWGLVGALGHWYLVAFDHDSGEERMFRLDRMKSAVVTRKDAQIPDDFDPGRYRGAFRDAEAGATIKFEISPAAARWFTEYYPLRSSEALPDGWVRVELTASSDMWAAVLLLQLGDDARKVSPTRFVDAARALAARIATKYVDD